jgi:hypothetical protein
MLRILVGALTWGIWKRKTLIIHIKKDMEFEIFRNSKFLFKNLNFWKSFTTCKWGVMCMTYKTKLEFMIQETIYKNLK